MTRFRVKAFFMHPGGAGRRRDRTATDGVFSDAEWTDGYLMGVLDEKDIPGLVQKGLESSPRSRAWRRRARASTRSVRSVEQVSAGCKGNWGARSPARPRPRKYCRCCSVRRNSMWSGSAGR